MDKEQARFILRSFRPDGTDVGDPDFTEALKLAMENRELGEWLASERAFDAAFANALGTVDLPEHLREDILACLAAERGDFPQAEDANDAAWIGALASIQPPASLRDTLITAMERTVTPEKAPSNISIFRRAAIPLAAAAGIALAFFITRQMSPGVKTASHVVPIAVVQAGFVRTFESPKFDLEEMQEDRQLLVRHLQDRKLPSPADLPNGLKNLKGLGCRELMIDGKRGSLICFHTGADGLVHMIIFRREDVNSELLQTGKPVFAQDGKWASARWEDDENVYLLMSQAPVGKLTELF